MSAKNTDKNNRFRSKIVSFRVSEQEWQQLDFAYKLSGMTKQDYLISRMQNQEIKIQPNPRMYKALKDELNTVLTQLQQIKLGEKLEVELLETINIIATTMNQLKESE